MTTIRLTAGNIILIVEAQQMHGRYDGVQSTCTAPSGWVRHACRDSEHRRRGCPSVYLVAFQRVDEWQRLTGVTELPANLERGELPSTLAMSFDRYVDTSDAVGAQTAWCTPHGPLKKSSSFFVRDVILG